MNQFQLFKTLRKHRKLAEKRSLNFQREKTAKYVIWFLAVFIFVYLMGISVLLSLIANESTSITSVELMCGILPVLLFLDFAFRFLAQQTPSQIVKPYVLLPISSYACIDHFIGSSLLSSGNLIWFSLLLPYLLMSVIFSYGLGSAFGLLLFFWLMVLANSQWYAIVRTLVNSSLKWWVLPLAVYAMVLAPGYLGHKKGIEEFFQFYSNVGTGITEGSMLPYLGALALLALLVYVNRKVQYRHIWSELSKTEQTHLRSVSQFAFLNRYGELGQYLQLEIKLILRNKNPRKSFIFASCTVLVFSLICSFTNIYDNNYMTNFLGLYNFMIYGAMVLLRIMCYEGNYIDGLMVRKENILSLFHAKYIIYSLILLFPFLLMLPTVIMGKWSLLMLVSYLVFTIGFQYFILFQMAVYNKQTIPLNTKFIGKNGMENNYFQVVVQLVILIVPMGLVSILQAFFSDTVAYLTMCLIGLAFIATNSWWQRNVYNRMMARKYENMEGFRASR